MSKSTVGAAVLAGAVATALASLATAAPLTKASGRQAAARIIPADGSVSRDGRANGLRLAPADTQAAPE
jgi:uncharacterized membrane protein